MDMPGVSVQRLIGPALIGSMQVGGYFLIQRSEAATAKSPPGWDELSPCSELTSIDSTKSLSLNRDFSTRLVDRSSSGKPERTVGTWSLINAERHVYRIDMPETVGVYVVVSPADAEGCIFAAGGDIGHVNLSLSWFSVNPADYLDRPQMPRSARQFLWGCAMRAV